MSDNEEQVLVTKGGFKKLTEELAELKNVRRREIAQRIKEASSYGDLSENSEYEDAKNEQAFVEGEILNIEKMVHNCIIIDESDLPEGVVSIGSTVTFREKGTDRIEAYKIVSTAECAPGDGKISNESSMGASLLDSKVGDIVTVIAPIGTCEYEVLEIQN